MAKRERELIFSRFDKNAENVNIFEYNKNMTLIYATNVLLGRAIPDVRDGLKPSERRILYTMAKDEHMKPIKSSQKKVAKIVGTCMGSYHPHGDSSIAGTLVGLAQWWKRYPLLLAPEGNFGSILGDEAAAMRYIETRIEPYAYECFFSEWSNNITDFIPNFTNETVEPEYLPAKYPVILISGATGIAVGMTVGIPPFNINELTDLMIKMVDDPNYKKCFILPDFPVPCDIVDKDNVFNDLCEKGEATLTLRGRAYVEGSNIIVKSLPYNVTVGAIVDKVKTLVEEKKLDGLEDFKDLTSDDEGKDIHLLFKVKSGYDPHKVLEMMYKRTSLQIPFVVRFNVVYDYSIINCNLRTVINEWIEFRRETKKRYYHSQYNTLRKEEHLLEMILGIFKKYGDDALINIMRKGKNRKVIVEKLISSFGLTDIQAEAIADQRLHQLSSENVEANEERLKELNASVAEYYDKLVHAEIIDAEIKDELKLLKKKYGRPRQTGVITMVDREIPNTAHIIVITRNGVIKKLPSENYQGAGTMGKGDTVSQVLKINNRDNLLLFDASGLVHMLPIQNLLDCNSDSYGETLDSYLTRPEGSEPSKIIAVMAMETEDIDKKNLIFATKNGLVKKTSYKNYVNFNRNSLVAISVKPGDELVSVTSVKGDKDIIMYTSGGMGIRFNSKEVSKTLRMSFGVNGIKLKKDDYVIGLDVIGKNMEYIFMITNKGSGKKALLFNFDNMKRGESGASLITLGDDEKLMLVKAVKDTDAIDVITSNRGAKLMVSEVPELTRRARGKKLISVKKSEIIIDVF